MCERRSRKPPETTAAYSTQEPRRQLFNLQTMLLLWHPCELGPRENGVCPTSSDKPPRPRPVPPTPPPSGGWVSGSWKCQTALSHPVLVREWAPGGMTSRTTSQTRQWNGDRTAMLITYVNVSKRAYFSVMLKSYTSNGYNRNGWADLQTRRVLKK